MTLSLIAYTFGILLLAHAGYSSFEFNHLVKTSGLRADFPVDIIIETLMSIAVIGYGAIASIENSSFYSIKNKKTNPDTKYLRPIEMTHAVKDFEKLGINDYQQYITRLDFIDIHEKRHQFTEWINLKD
ncbi:uncharacterized protein PRCAT00003097001 [Priceomyces carsonii]|uniref:uncharacterized protein n=1 Tax=Priceomyces carsonii TaxID=28549 RepID=UPI002ED82852|nr:unnamed protein product [Priceomyces carsonii]